MINKVLGLLGISAKAGKIVSGTDIVIENIEKDKLKLVIIAEDSADRTKSNFEYLCKKRKIPIYILGNIDSNSKAIGKPNRAVIGIKDENLAKAIISKIIAEVK